MTFDPYEWTIHGYLNRYGCPETAIEMLRKDCLTGIDSETGKLLVEIEPKLRRFVCAQYMFWIHHLIKKSINSLKKTLAFGPLKTLYYGCPEIAKKIEETVTELEKNIVETEEGGYVLKGMSKLEQELYLDHIIKELYTEFMKFLKDKLGDFYYEVQDYFMNICKRFDISPLPEKLLSPTTIEIKKDESKKEEK
uniref:Uncharacterized protein n=1 Tax=Archaeoglobus fulgidus TaxID=2234 RepID=A0A7J2THY3_ARCFL